MTKIVIIGGVAAGASAAAKARRQDEFAEIHLFERLPEISYANCGLPYYVGGEIDQDAALIMSNAKKMWDRYRVQVHTECEVIRIDRQRKSIDIKSLKDGTVSQHSYDKLLMAMGATATLPPVEGLAEAQNVSFLRTVGDARRLRDLADAKKIKRVMVLGGGFIGIEAAEQLHRQGLGTHIIDLAPHILPGYDSDLVVPIEAALREDGIAIDTGIRDLRFEVTDRNIQAATFSGRRVECDFVVVAAGVKPASELAQAAGLALGLRGAIKVNEHLQTSDPDIYAAGDVIESVHGVTGQPAWIALGGPANFQGRVAAINMTGGNADGTLARAPRLWGTSIVRAGRYAIARVGISKREATEAGLRFIESTIETHDHAAYYPGAQDLVIKLLVEPENGKILGVQVLGGAQSSVDKQIDTFSVAMQAGMTIEALQYLQLAYAPPYGAAKNPVNVAAMVASNRLSGIESAASYEAVVRDDNRHLLDVRSPGEHPRRVDASLTCPVDMVRDAITKLPKDGKLYLYCKAGQRGYVAYRILKQRGYAAVENIDGGYDQIERVKLSE